MAKLRDEGRINITHPVIVCLKHKLTFHCARVAGCHARSHRMDYYEARRQYLFIEIGQCNVPSCDKKRLMRSTDAEIKLAYKILKRKKITEKLRSE